MTCHMSQTYKALKPSETKRILKEWSKDFVEPDGTVGSSYTVCVFLVFFVLIQMLPLLPGHCLS